VDCEGELLLFVLEVVEESFAISGRWDVEGWVGLLQDIGK
jgi:hypothetical protein